MGNLDRYNDFPYVKGVECTDCGWKEILAVKNDLEGGHQLEMECDACEETQRFKVVDREKVPAKKRLKMELRETLLEYDTLSNKEREEAMRTVRSEL